MAADQGWSLRGVPLYSGMQATANCIGCHRLAFTHVQDSWSTSTCTTITHMDGRHYTYCNGVLPGRMDGRHIWISNGVFPRHIHMDGVLPGHVDGGFLGWGFAWAH